MRPTTSRKRAHVERKAHYYIVTKKVGVYEQASGPADRKYHSSCSPPALKGENGHPWLAGKCDINRSWSIRFLREWASEASDIRITGFVQLNRLRTNFSRSFLRELSIAERDEILLSVELILRSFKSDRKRNDI